MTSIANTPILTDVFESPQQLCNSGPSSFIFRNWIEDRSSVPSLLQSLPNQFDFVPVAKEEEYTFTVSDNTGEEHEYSLRSQRSLQEFLRRWITKPRCYLDISGLRHHVWAPLLKALLRSPIETHVVYVEPADYKPISSHTKSWIYEEGASISEISPLPGFERPFSGNPDRELLVPLLGFEGARFAHVLEQVHPLREKVAPIVGVPGFRLEYPYRTLIGNKEPLSSSQSWRRMKLVTANCPFGVYYALNDFHRSYPDHVLRIALIGTKPHAVGGILYAIDNPQNTELIFDHPHRRTERTVGQYRILSYSVSAFRPSR